jgi:hypothetical protein
VDSLETVTQEHFWHLLERSGFKKIGRIVDASAPDVPLDERVEIYFAYSPEKKGNVTIKIKANGSVAERYIITDIKHPVIPEYYRAFEFTEAGIPFAVITYEHFPTKKPIHRLEQRELSKKEKGNLLESFIEIGRGLQVLEQHGLVHCDLNPKHILLEPDFTKPKLIDPEDAVRMYEDTVSRGTSEFFTGGIASPNTHARALAKTIEWTARTFRFFGEEPFKSAYELTKTAGEITPELIIEKLELPRKQRAQTIRHRIIAAIGVVGVAVSAGVTRYGVQAYKEQQQSLPVQVKQVTQPVTRTHVEHIRNAIADELGDNVETYIPQSASTIVSFGSTIDGILLEESVGSMHGTTAVSLLAQAAKRDRRVLPALRAHANNLVSLIKTRSFVLGSADNVNAAPLIEAYVVDRNPAYLEAIRLAGDWLTQPEHIKRHPGGTIIPLIRWAQGDSAKIGRVNSPWLDVSDVQTADILLAASKAHIIQTGNYAADPYISVLRESIQSLQKLVHHDTVYQYVSLRTSTPVVAGKPTVLGQVQLADFFWRAGMHLNDEDLMATSRMLVTPLLTGVQKQFFTEGKKDTYAAALALQLAERQEMPFPYRLAQELIQNIDTNKKINGFIRGVCLPEPFHKSATGVPICGGTYAGADAAFIRR